MQPVDIVEEVVLFLVLLDIVTSPCVSAVTVRVRYNPLVWPKLRQFHCLLLIMSARSQPRSTSNQTCPCPPQEPQIHPLWSEKRFSDESPFFVNSTAGMVSLVFPAASKAVTGGILADEVSTYLQP